MMCCAEGYQDINTGGGGILLATSSNSVFEKP